MAPTAVARNQPRVPVLDGKLYVVGGYDGDTGNSSSSVERYDPATNARARGGVAALATRRDLIMALSNGWVVGLEGRSTLSLCSERALNLAPARSRART